MVLPKRASYVFIGVVLVMIVSACGGGGRHYHRQRVNAKHSHGSSLLQLAPFRRRKSR